MLLPPTNSNLLIRSIRKGVGPTAVFYKVGTEWSRIEQDYKVVGWDGESAKKSLVYLIYDKDMNLVHEIEHGSQLTITYFRKVEEMATKETTNEK